MIRIDPLEDCHLRDGCYQPAHTETVEWRTGWRNGFVRKWKDLSKYCADQCFVGKDGWTKGIEAGKRDASNKCPAYPHRKGRRKGAPEPFRVAWRLGWYKAYYESGGCGDKHKFGCGYNNGRKDAADVYNTPLDS